VVAELVTLVVALVVDVGFRLEVVEDVVVLEVLEVVVVLVVELVELEEVVVEATTVVDWDVVPDTVIGAEALSLLPSPTQ